MGLLRTTGLTIAGLGTEAKMGLLRTTGLTIAGLGTEAKVGLLRTTGLTIAGLGDRKSTRLNSSHSAKSRMPSSA